MAGEEFAELEVRVERREASSYSVEMTLIEPESAAPVTLSELALAEFDMEALAKLRDARDFDGYGKLLTAGLLANKDAYSLFNRARNLDTTLRVVFKAGFGAENLHDHCWEAICDPKSGNRLLESDRFVFSRFLTSIDQRPIRLRSRRNLKALIAVANPKPSTKYPLAPLPADEVKRAKAALGDIDVNTLDGPLTLDALHKELERDPCDVLYLICHGSRGKSGSILYLESSDGTVEPVPARTFVKHFAELSLPPSLVVFAACESAAPGKRTQSTAAEPGATASIGPLLLAQTSVAAVIAMQDAVTQETASTFMNAFFVDLSDHGHVEVAVGSGRDAIADRHDWWIPVLFSRLRTGQIWYSPGFGDDENEQKLWRSIISNIEERHVTAILGADLLNHVVGPTSDIAHDILRSFFAERLGDDGNASAGNDLPFSNEIRNDLVQVTQFLAVMEEESVVRSRLREAFKSRIAARFGDAMVKGKGAGELVDIVSRAGKHLRESNTTDPFTALAALPLCFYVTTTPDHLLVDALAAVERAPETRVFAWRSDDNHAGPAEKPGAIPPYKDRTPDKPFVWYLLGNLSDPESLVLTEDNYLDFHSAISNTRAWVQYGTDANVAIDGSNRNVVDPALLRAIGGEDALMFLGFNLDDWSFRVLFRSIVDLQQSDLRISNRRASVAVQIAPDETRIRNPALARDYLHGYFRKAGIGADVYVYWGTAGEFLQELLARMKRDDA